MKKYEILQPDEIEARSFEIVAQLLPDHDPTRPEWPLVRRIVHATGDPSIAPFLRIHPRAVESGVKALLEGRPILADTRMLAAGLGRGLAARLGCEIVCAVGEPAVRELARERRTTRSAAAVHHLLARIPGSIVAIGNAPTALYALLEALDEGLAAPALIVATPVGFVGAAHSKDTLIDIAPPSLPYVTVLGPRGGTAMAVAAVNALLRLAAGGWSPPERPGAVGTDQGSLP